MFISIHVDSNFVESVRYLTPLHAVVVMVKPLNYLRHTELAMQQVSCLIAKEWKGVYEGSPAFMYGSLQDLVVIPLCMCVCVCVLY